MNPKAYRIRTTNHEHKLRHLEYSGVSQVETKIVVQGRRNSYLLFSLAFLFRVRSL